MSRGSARAAKVFEALGDEKRLAILLKLSSGGPQSIHRLTAGSGVTRQAITKHLHVLESAGLVRDARRGREDVWELDTKRLDEARRWLEQLRENR